MNTSRLEMMKARREAHLHAPRRGRVAGPAAKTPLSEPPSKLGSGEALQARVASVSAAVSADKLLEPEAKQLTLDYLKRGGYHQASVLLDMFGNARLALHLEAALSAYLANPDNIETLKKRPVIPGFAPNLSYDLIYKNGIRGIGKPLFDEAASDKARLPRSANVEVDAYRVDRRLGFFLVPVTTALDFPASANTERPSGSVQYWIHPIADLEARLFDLIQDNAVDFGKVQVAKLKMLDFVMGNNDRGYVMNMRNTLRIGPVRVAIDNAQGLWPKALAEHTLAIDMDVVSPQPFAYIVSDVMFVERGDLRNAPREVTKAIGALTDFTPEELTEMLDGRHHPESIKRAADRLELLVRAFAHAKTPKVKALTEVSSIERGQAEMFKVIGRDVRGHY